MCSRTVGGSVYSRSLLNYFKLNLIFSIMILRKLLVVRGYWIALIVHYQTRMFWLSLSSTVWRRRVIDLDLDLVIAGPSSKLNCCHSYFHTVPKATIIIKTPQILVYLIFILFFRQMIKFCTIYLIWSKKRRSNKKIRFCAKIDDPYSPKYHVYRFLDLISTSYPAHPPILIFPYEIKMNF